MQFDSAKVGEFFRARYTQCFNGNALGRLGNSPPSVPCLVAEEVDRGCRTSFGPSVADLSSGLVVLIYYYHKSDGG